MLLDLERFKRILESTNIKNLSLEESRAACLIALICKLSYKEELIEAVEFIGSNNKYAEYIKKLAAFPNVKCNFLEDIDNIMLDKSIETISLKLEKVIATMYADRFLLGHTRVSSLSFVERELSISTLPGIFDILSNGYDGLSLTKMARLYANIAQHFYKQMELHLTDNPTLDSYYTLRGLRKETLDQFINKCSLLGITDSDEYKAVLGVEFLIPIMGLASKTMNLGFIDNVSSMLLLELSDKYGYESTEVEAYINGMLQRKLEFKDKGSNKHDIF